ncbi:hypothetical protein BHE74_00027187 [Ensete ventricosum]|nr:hypothetical protein BHE74_00027187 [Ensete ventricosum]RZR86870.1 hypothetical protein BHM03_00014156 [Ensete ventricosum]
MVVEFKDAVASSYMKKTTVLSATQVVFCNALFDGVVVVEFEDAVVGSMESLDFEDAVVGSCTKKTTARRRETEGAGSDCDVKQRKGSNHVDMLRKKGWPVAIAGAIEKTNGKGAAGRGAATGREEMGCRSASLAMHYSIAGPISTKQRKKKGNRRGPGPSQDSEHSQAPRLREHLQGRRPRMPRLLERWRGRRSGGGRGGGFHWRMCRRRLLSLSVRFQEIYSNEKEKVASLAVRSCPAATASQKRDR